MATHWEQILITLPAMPRGFHLITQRILAEAPALRRYRVGLAHLMILHTSASLTLNENAAPTVRGDFERHFNRLAPDGAPHYQHRDEGPDDMAAHLKAALLGSSLTMPIRDGHLLLGTWQGIYLGEHRDHAGPRQLALTLTGEWQDG